MEVLSIRRNDPRVLWHGLGGLSGTRWSSKCGDDHHSCCNNSMAFWRPGGLPGPHVETSAPGGWGQGVSAFVRLWENQKVQNIWKWKEAERLYN